MNEFSRQRDDLRLERERIPKLIDSMKRNVPAMAMGHDPLLGRRILLGLGLKLAGEFSSSPLPGSVTVAVRPVKRHDLAARRS
jgi:hypothetical protein